jgi:glyoxylase-like metal-dependent hydrolase (beta-lactamase superfamily II)
VSDPPIINLDIPNPFFEGRNRVYVIRADPVTMIDTGVATQRAFDALVDRLAEHGLSIGDIGRVILTHKHVDHIGNAWRIQQQSGAEIMIHESEMHAVQEVDPGGRTFSDLVRERLTLWQVPADAFPKSKESAGPSWEIEPADPTPLVDGQRIELGGDELEVIHTPGHTYGSICLKFGRMLLSGDHVLPDISPNIGGGDMRRRGLLKDFLQSLQRVSDLESEIDNVLPGHGQPFPDLSARCRALRDHHGERLEKILDLLEKKGPLRVYETARNLFGEMNDFHIVLGCAEAHAHLEYLVDEGRVICELGEYRTV